MRRLGEIVGRGIGELFKGYCIGIGIALGLLTTVTGYVYLSALMGWQP
jgi:hypothetical protein